ncbi:MAG: electron transport complex subunit RsxC [Clostridia bacterium]|nr:electron transport complex subunit RsxC [Clostridia bacterium]
MLSLFKLGAIRVPHRKNTASLAAERMSAPKTVLLPLSQHIGAPATPKVKPGDAVFVGTVVAEATGYVSSPVHSSVSGTVKKIEEFLSSNGRVGQAILIESDGLMTPDPEIKPPTLESFDDFSRAVRESGLVGLGGAGFPTAVKLDAEKRGQINAIVINAAECEPYITTDTRTMIDDADDVVGGVELLLRFISAERVYIGIEKNKPECISLMKEKFAENERVEVVALPSNYPQGAEKVLIYNTTGRVVPEGGLPADVGVLVMNVTSVAFLSKYAATGMPLVEKRLTVDGSAIKTPKNVIAPIGTSIGEVIEFAGGFSCEVGKILMGGPMMGVAVYDVGAPILKNTNAITALDRKDSEEPKRVACIHCGRCVAHCPIGLNPTIYAKAMNITDEPTKCEMLEAAKINLCMECGCCSFVCPSKRPLVETNRMAKGELRDYKAHLASLEGEKKV